MRKAPFVAASRILITDRFLSFAWVIWRIDARFQYLRMARSTVRTIFMAGARFIVICTLTAVIQTEIENWVFQALLFIRQGQYIVVIV